MSPTPPSLTAVSSTGLGRPAWRAVAGVLGVVLVMNVVAWAVLLGAVVPQNLTLGAQVFGVGLGVTAFTLGVRHAFDIDHIAAIDNVTRKLMQEGKRPVAVGFMFSLGHSTIVAVGSLAIAATALSMQHRLDAVRSIGAVLGTLISTVFLFAIAILNLFVLRSICRTFTRVRRGEPYIEEDFDLLLGNRSFLGRLFRPAFKFIRCSSHMYPLGILFGLGFDTATEIAVLGISAAEASNGLSLWAILVFPALFAAGMSLIDTTDNILMLGAYGWAFVKPIRKLYYNITITVVSVVVAFSVGGIEALGLLAARFGFNGSFWQLVAKLNENFGVLGFGVIALFVLSWVASIALYKWQGFDRLEGSA